MRIYLNEEQREYLVNLLRDQLDPVAVVIMFKLEKASQKKDF